MLALVLGLSFGVNGAAGDDVELPSESAVPKFRWGQTKDKVFITVVVKDLEKESVQIAFQADRLSFQALGSSGRTFALDLEILQDVDVLYVTQ